METVTNAATGKTVRQLFRQCKDPKKNTSILYVLDPDDHSKYSFRSGGFTGDDPASRDAFVALLTKISPTLGTAAKEVQGEFQKGQKSAEKTLGKFRLKATDKHLELTTVPGPS